MPKQRARLLITVELFATVFLWLFSPLFTAIVALALPTCALSGAYRRTFPKRPRGLSGLTLPTDDGGRVGVRRV